MATDIDICNAAILMVGGEEITSLTDDEGTQEQKLCATFYQRSKENLISTFPWRFTIGQVQLAKLVDTPVFGYDFAYQLPSNFLQAEDISDTSDTYRIYEDKLYTNIDPVSIAYQFDDPDESKFPAYFTRLLEYDLALLLAIPLNVDGMIYDRLKVEKKEQMIRARATDSKIQVNTKLKDVNFILVNVRP